MAVASVVIGASLSSGTWAMPTANADDPLAPIIAAVNGDRAKTRCAQLNYSAALEGGAQAYARSENSNDAAGGYDGATASFLGSGDPQAVAINSAYRKGAGERISDCSFTEFGVGFIRHDDRSVDVVTIVFGTPNVEAPVAAAPPLPQPVQCPAGSPTPTVPAGQACAPPTYSVTVAVTGAGFRKINVTLTNSATIDASCDYTAVPLGDNPFGLLQTFSKTVAVKAKGTVILNENAPPPGVTYQLSVPCTGTFNGNSVVLGTSSQTVKG
jgi:hypothetical protein